MAEPIPFAELELRIALLPPISRGVHLGGPTLHARRLVQLWRGGEMTAGEISEASNDELIARYTVIDSDGVEANAIYAEGELRLRAARPTMKEVGDREVLERAWERVRGGKEITLDAVKNYLREIELATPKKPPPETPKPLDRAAHWGDDDVPLSQAFRLLDVETVAVAIARTALMSDNGDYPNDSVHWPLPPFSDLLPELQAAVWEALLDGTLLVEAIKGLRGARRQAVLPVELARLRPDWSLSRLCLGERDEFIAARVRRAPTNPVKKRWRGRPSDAAVADVMRKIAKDYGQDARPAFSELWKAVKNSLPKATREQVRVALENEAPRLRGQRGYRSKT